MAFTTQRLCNFSAFKGCAALCLYLVFSTIFSAAFADTYKCQVNGVVSYSDKPCKESPQPLQLPKYQAPEKKSGKAAISDKEKYHQLNVKLETARKKRAMQREAEALKLQIEETRQAKADTLKKIRQALEEIDFDSDDIDDDILAEETEVELKAELRKADQAFGRKIDALESELGSLQQQIRDMSPE